MGEPKKMYRSTTDRKIAGVCGGLAAYMDVDVNIIRVVWALLFLCASFGLLAYIVCWIVFPEQ